MQENEKNLTPEQNTTTRARRSSILKSGKPKNRNVTIIDEEEVIVDVKSSKRVSFAANYFVKPFAADPDKNTIWDITYEEEVNHTDSTASTSPQNVYNTSLCISLDDQIEILPEYKRPSVNVEIYSENTTEIEKKIKNFNKPQNKIFTVTTDDKENMKPLDVTLGVGGPTNKNVLPNDSKMLSLDAINMDITTDDKENMKPLDATISSDITFKLPICNSTTIANENRNVNQTCFPDESMNFTKVGSNSIFENERTQLFLLDMDVTLGAGVPTNKNVLPNNSNIFSLDAIHKDTSNIEDNVNLTPTLKDETMGIHATETKTLFYKSTTKKNVTICNYSNMDITSNSFYDVESNNGILENRETDKTVNEPCQMELTKCGSTEPENLSIIETNICKKNNMSTEFDETMEFTCKIPENDLQKLNQNSSLKKKFMNQNMAVTSYKQFSNLDEENGSKLDNIEKKFNMSNKDESMEFTCHIPSKSIPSHLDVENKENLSKIIACGNNFNNYSEEEMDFTCRIPYKSIPTSNKNESDIVGKISNNPSKDESMEIDAKLNTSTAMFSIPNKNETMEFTCIIPRGNISVSQINEQNITKLEQPEKKNLNMLTSEKQFITPSKDESMESTCCLQSSNILRHQADKENVSKLDISEKKIGISGKNESMEFTCQIVSKNIPSSHTVEQKLDKYENNLNITNKEESMDFTCQISNKKLPSSNLIEQKLDVSKNNLISSESMDFTCQKLSKSIPTSYSNEQSLSKFDKKPTVGIFKNDEINISKIDTNLFSNAGEHDFQNELSSPADSVIDPDNKPNLLKLDQKTDLSTHSTLEYTSQVCLDNSNMPENKENKSIHEFSKLNISENAQIHPKSVFEDNKNLVSSCAENLSNCKFDKILKNRNTNEKGAPSVIAELSANENNLQSVSHTSGVAKNKSLGFSKSVAIIYDTKMENQDTLTKYESSNVDQISKHESLIEEHNLISLDKKQCRDLAPSNLESKSSTIINKENSIVFTCSKTEPVNVPEVSVFNENKSYAESIINSNENLENDFNIIRTQNITYRVSNMNNSETEAKKSCMPNNNGDANLAETYIIPENNKNDTQNCTNESRISIQIPKQQNETLLPKPLDNTNICYADSFVLKDEGLKYDPVIEMDISQIEDPASFHMNFTSFNQCIEDTQQMLRMSFSKPDASCFINTPSFMKHKNYDITNVENNTIAEEEISKKGSFKDNQGNVQPYRDNGKSMSDDFHHLSQESSLEELNDSPNDSTLDIAPTTSSSKRKNLSERMSGILGYKIELEKFESIYISNVAAKELTDLLQKKKRVDQKLRSRIRSYQKPSIEIPTLSYDPVDFNQYEIEDRPVKKQKQVLAPSCLELKMEKNLKEKICEAAKSCSLWRLKSFENDNYVFSTLFNTLKVSVELFHNSERVKNITTEQQLDDDCPPMAFFVLNVFQEKLKGDHVASILGYRYDLLALIDYIGKTMKELMFIYEEYDNLSIEHGVRINRGLSFVFNIYNVDLIISWKIMVNMQNMNCIDVEDITIETEVGMPANEKTIKNLAKNCPKGFPFLRKFIEKIKRHVQSEEKKRFRNA